MNSAPTSLENLLSRDHKGGRIATFTNKNKYKKYKMNINIVYKLRIICQSGKVRRFEILLQCGRCDHSGTRSMTTISGGARNLILGAEPPVNPNPRVTNMVV